VDQVVQHLPKQAWSPEFNPQYCQKKLINGIASNSKASGQQRKQLPEQRDSLQNGRK
jgi:hypothetical protein